MQQFQSDSYFGELLVHILIVGMLVDILGRKLVWEKELVKLIFRVPRDV